MSAGDSPSFWAKEEFTRVTTKNVKVNSLIRENFAGISTAIRDIPPPSISPNPGDNDCPVHPGLQKINFVTELLCAWWTRQTSTRNCRFAKKPPESGKKLLLSSLSISKVGLALETRLAKTVSARILLLIEVRLAAMGRGRGRKQKLSRFVGERYTLPQSGVGQSGLWPAVNDRI